MGPTVKVPVPPPGSEWAVLRRSAPAGADAARKARGLKALTRYRCRCSCGEERDVLAQHIRSGRSATCGHWVGTGPTTTHPRAWDLWHKRVRRDACERWQDFDAYYADVGDKPEGAELYRLDEGELWGPGNWQWAALGSAAARRSGAAPVLFRGVLMLRAHVAKELGISRQAFDQRLRAGKTGAALFGPRAG
jgi:hypothetical protein